MALDAMFVSPETLSEKGKTNSALQFPDQWQHHETFLVADCCPRRNEAAHNLLHRKDAKEVHRFVAPRPNLERLPISFAHFVRIPPDSVFVVRVQPEPANKRKRVCDDSNVAVMSSQSLLVGEVVLDLNTPKHIEKRSLRVATIDILLSCFSFFSRTQGAWASSSVPARY